MNISCKIKREKEWFSLMSKIEANLSFFLPNAVSKKELLKDLLFDNPLISDLAYYLKDTKKNEDFKLKNLKGRPANTFKNNKSKIPIPSTGTREEELLLISGKVKNYIYEEYDEVTKSIKEASDFIKEKNSSEVKKDYELLPFTYQIRTKFSSLSNKLNMLYSLNTKKDNSIFLTHKDASLVELLESEDFDVNQIRLGLEKFKASISIFNTIPVVYESMYLEINDKEVSILWKKFSPLSSPPKEGSKLKDLVYKITKSLDTLLKTNKINETTVNSLKENNYIFN